MLISKRLAFAVEVPLGWQSSHQPERGYLRLNRRTGLALNGEYSPRRDADSKFIAHAVSAESKYSVCQFHAIPWLKVFPDGLSSGNIQWAERKTKGLCRKNCSELNGTSLADGRIGISVWCKFGFGVMFRGIFTDNDWHPVKMFSPIHEIYYIADRCAI